MPCINKTTIEAYVNQLIVKCVIPIEETNTNRTRNSIGIQLDKVFGSKSHHFCHDNASSL